MDDELFVWVTDRITGHSYPRLKAYVAENPDAFEAHPDEPVRDDNGELRRIEYAAEPLASVANDAAAEPAASKTTKKPAPAASTEA